MEGLDGCGKTTQAKLLVKNLQSTYDAVYTAEPTQGKIGKLIREYCLHGKKRMSAVVEALLFAADRFEHLTYEVLPALKDGKVAISDRYVYSSLAYQGATGLDLDWIRKLNVHAIRPDLALFIDVPPEIVIQRMKPAKSVMENLETQQKVRKTYLKFVESNELIKIDGNKTQKAVAEEILTVVLKFLEEVC
jgi:dTMP kinase